MRKVGLSLPSCNYIKGWRTGTFIPSAMKNFAPPSTPTSFIQADGGGCWIDIPLRPGCSLIMNRVDLRRQKTLPAGTASPPRALTKNRRNPSAATLQDQALGTWRRLSLPSYPTKEAFFRLLYRYSVPEQHLVSYRFCSKKVPAKLRCF